MLLWYIFVGTVTIFFFALPLFWVEPLWAIYVSDRRMKREGGNLRVDISEDSPDVDLSDGGVDDGNIHLFWAEPH